MKEEFEETKLKVKQCIFLDKYYFTFNRRNYERNIYIELRII
jgi:hypothetical protein